VWYERFKRPLAFAFVFASVFALIAVTVSVVRPQFFGQMAQIIAVDVPVLKMWQESEGLQDTLVNGSSGGQVRLLQHMLSQDLSIYPEASITGYFGPLTKEAVSRFQMMYDLPVTGVINDNTRRKLNEVFFEHLCPKAPEDTPDRMLTQITHDYPLEEDYVPQGLINITGRVPTQGIVCLRADVLPYLKEMFLAARKENIALSVTSGFRKPAIQQHLFDYWIDLEGPDAVREIARPGVSEHQLGTVVDLTDSSIEYKSTSDMFDEGDGWQWLREHAHEYGFVMSYPEGNEDLTGFGYEPWHWCYVGKDVASALYSRNMLLIELESDEIANILADVRDVE
jgi:LAS superfamily LD-carboxypeptidase LdcB